ncbi:hypothetical protein [Dactylosporangium aurantiacum]|uniref:hypothetical protein n=1 Tax=Dactylosporangium aurantiacum TaxID=35754 RepID=UPI001FE144A9|nr:hypothetical protein [Dactylosporangium aurantiacum]MDG6101604.1 hypothetical protein [Dactylosporangium aurantiacum]
MDGVLKLDADRLRWTGFEADRCNVALGLLNRTDHRIGIGGRAVDAQGRHASRRYPRIQRPANVHSEQTITDQ